MIHSNDALVTFAMSSVTSDTACTSTASTSSTDTVTSTSTSTSLSTSTSTSTPTSTHKRSHDDPTLDNPYLDAYNDAMKTVPDDMDRYVYIDLHFRYCFVLSCHVMCHVSCMLSVSSILLSPLIVVTISLHGISHIKIDIDDIMHMPYQQR